MCGFIGFLSNTNINSENKNNLTNMSSIINHRGPDECGEYIDDNIILCFRRLSIIALDSGKQPFSYDNNNYKLIFNGEIYNYIELREQIIKDKNITFSTDAEGEVILAYYKHYGKSFVSKLRGMFSFVIWDKINNKIIGARDPFGIKPFYYSESSRGLYFGSELKSFTKNKEIYKKEINSKSLHDYLTFQFVPEHNTMFENIKLLKPGHILEKKINQKTKFEAYWTCKFDPILKPQAEKIKDIKKALEESVKLHMRSDVPVGCFLSGGIDSTIITALSAKINPNIKTFTIGFKDEGYSEIELAKKTAENLGVENINITISPEEYMEAVPKVIWHLDGPVADPSVIPIYYICKEARKHVTVMLSGEGSDELFGGYNIYREPNSLKLFKHLPTPLCKILKYISTIFPEGMKGKSFLERGTTPIEKRYLGNAKIFKDHEKKPYLKSYNKNYTYDLVTKPLYDKCKNYNDVTKMQYIDINTWLKGDILVKSDRMSMANSLELRVPFLDKEVFKIASTLTLDEKINQKTTKYLLRESFKDILPEDTVLRKKLGYPVPIRKWLKKEMYDWALNIIKNSKADEYINKERVIELLNKHKNGKIDYSRKLWVLITFIIWYEKFIEEV